jgi:hypothetical protein
MTVTGERAVMRELEKFEKKAPYAVVGALFELGETIMDAAVDRAPLDTGELRRSAYVAIPERLGNAWVIDLGFGAEHALRVHESTERNYRAGEAKFLEKAIMEHGRAGMRKVVKSATRRLVGPGLRPQTTRGRYPARPR